MKFYLILLVVFNILASSIIGQTKQDSIHYFSKLFPENGIFLRPDSLPDGVWIAFCETNKNQIGLKLHYKNSNLNGESISFWPNGNIQQRGFYKDGCFVEKNERWYKDGTKEDEGFCEAEDYKKHFYHCNTWNYWSKKGEQLIKDGTGKYISYHDNDTLQVTGEYINGLQTGKWTWYYKNGALQYIEHFQNGKQDGEYIFYYGNGQIRSKGMYAKSKQVGKWDDWYDDGKNE